MNQTLIHQDAYCKWCVKPIRYIPPILCLGPTRGDNEYENENENENENKKFAQDGAVTPHRIRVPIMLMSLSASGPISFQMSNFFSLFLYNACRLSYKALFFSTSWIINNSPVSSMLAEDHVFVTSGINILWLVDAFSRLGWGGKNRSQTDFGKIVFGLGLLLVFVALGVTATIHIALERCQSVSCSRSRYRYRL